MMEIKETNDIATYLSGTGTVILEFFSTTCGPCKMLNFMLHDLVKQESGDGVILQIDFDKNPDLTAAYQVQSYPTLIKLQDGKETARMQGLKAKPQIADFIFK